MTEGARNSTSQCNKNNCREGAHLEYDAARDLGVHLGFGDDLPDCRTVQVEALGTIGVKTAAKVGGEKATGATEGARRSKKSTSSIRTSSDSSVAAYGQA